jgi:hypothetical protein
MVMVRFGLVSVVLALGGWLAPLAIADTVPPTPTIILEKATHFLSPSGEDVLIQPGTYAVEQAEGWIQFIPLGGENTDAILLEANHLTHTETVQAPTALSRSESEDELVVALLLPDGTALEALGSYSGIRSKATRPLIGLRPPVTQRLDMQRPLPDRLGGQVAGGSSTSGLYAELVAQLHNYIGHYKKLVSPELSASNKEVKVTGITLSSADGTNLSVRFTVRIREVLSGAVLYTLDGSARGQFHFGQITSTEACIAAPLGSYTALTVTSLDIPRVSGPNEYDGAKRAIAANFPPNVCVPLYPSITISNAGGEECVQKDYKPAPIPNKLLFTVTLSNLSARNVTVRYATADGSARAGTDYSAVSGTLTLPTLSSRATISVALSCRLGDQGTRTFILNLTNPGNGILADNQGQGVIIDFISEP